MAATMFAHPPAAETLGGRLIQARSYARLRQRDIEAALDVSRRTLSSWEHDRTSPTVRQLLRIAEVTGFDATWFVTGLSESDAGITHRFLLPITPDPWDEPTLFDFVIDITSEATANPHRDDSNSGVVNGPGHLQLSRSHQN